MLKRWDFTASSSLQYRLEKMGYLVGVSIFFIALVKIVLFPFFANLIDSLSEIVPGAMCGAGVMGANEYGLPLLGLKIVIIYLCGVWLLLNREDMNAKNYPLMRKKLIFFVVLFSLILLEFILQIVYFLNIELKEPVACCSLIFGNISTGDKIPFGLDITALLLLFYLLFALSVLSSWMKNSFLTFVANGFFLYISYYALVYFFGTYIYELPTHQCPFCMLQKEYNYIGFFLYFSLFLGTFFGMAHFVLKLLSKKSLDRVLIYSLIFNTIFVISCTLYPTIYYLKNGVFL